MKNIEKDYIIIFHLPLSNSVCSMKCVRLHYWVQWAFISVAVLFKLIFSLLLVFSTSSPIISILLIFANYNLHSKSMVSTCSLNIFISVISMALCDRHDTLIHFLKVSYLFLQRWVKVPYVIQYCVSSAEVWK